LLGIAEYSQQQYSRSADVLNRLILRDPKNARAHNALGAAKMELNDLETASKHFRTAIALNPEMADAHYNLAQILVSLNPPDIVNARMHYQKSVDLGSAQDLVLENALSGQ
ncbi:MAG: tetratricopeptide repeat protein, partial [Verrucomicrobiota bacterium]